ncbi:ATP-binding protein [Microlunatus sp. Y2014]|uniref:ATP-binding protein n=1 Tax=Microlunatus sp. Y2014 TaxID=3418488 RepID=UPI003DA797F3
MDGPFFPGAGTSPFRLEGRETEIRLWQRVMADFDMFGRSQARHLIIQGVRGVGKTSLLKVFADEALQAGCLAVRVRCQTIGRETLMDRITAAVDEALQQRPAKHHGPLTMIGVTTPVGGLELAREVTSQANPLVDTAFMRKLLEAVSAVVERGGIGLALLIDETQYADQPSLVNISELVSLIGERDGDRPPLFVTFAGLPDDTVGKVGRSSSHAERVYRRIDLGYLDDAAARDALQLPVQHAGGRWTEDALTTTVAASGGYPAFIQEYGNAIWELRRDGADGAPVLDLAVAEAGIKAAAPQIDAYFEGAWQAAPPLGRECLVALARAGGRLRMRDLAAALGRESSSEISWAVDELKQRGTVAKPERGVVVFGRAGMDDWVLAHTDDEGTD